MPGQMAADYVTWPSLPDLFPVSFPGVKTSRDDVVVDIDRDQLVKRMKDYFDPDITHEEMRQTIAGGHDQTPTASRRRRCVINLRQAWRSCRIRSSAIATVLLMFAGFIGSLKPSCSTRSAASISRTSAGKCLD